MRCHLCLRLYSHFLVVKIIFNGANFCVYLDKIQYRAQL